MKKESITIQFEAEKLRATRRYMVKKDADLVQELCDQIQRLYEKHVPANVREYIDEGMENEVSSKSSSKNQKEKNKNAPTGPL